MLKMIQDGKSTLPGVALIPDDPTPGTSGQIAYGSNAPRPSLNNPFGRTATNNPLPSNTGYV